MRVVAPMPDLDEDLRPRIVRWLMSAPTASALVVAAIMLVPVLGEHRFPSSEFGGCDFGACALGAVCSEHDLVAEPPPPGPPCSSRTSAIDVLECERAYYLGKLECPKRQDVYLYECEPLPAPIRVRESPLDLLRGGRVFVGDEGQKSLATL